MGDKDGDKADCKSDTSCAAMAVHVYPKQKKKRPTPTMDRYQVQQR